MKHSSSSPHRSTTVFIFIFFLSFSLFITNGYFTTSMDIDVYKAALNLIEKHRMGMEEQLLTGSVGLDGRFYVMEGIPVISTAAIFVGISKLVGISSGKLVLMTNHVLFAIMCVLIFAIAMAFKYSYRTSIFLSVTYGLGTMALVHSRYLYPELLISLCAVGAFLSLIKYRHNRNDLWLVLEGSLNGILLLIRPDMILFVLGLSVGTFYVFYREMGQKQFFHREQVMRAIYFMAPLIFFLLIFFYYNHIRFGNVFTTGYTLSDRGMIDGPRREVIENISYPGRLLAIGETIKGFLGMWLIPCRSLFIINPVLVFTLFSLPLFWKKFRFEFIVMGCIFISYVYLYANRGPAGFAGSAAWGIRYMLPMVGFMVLPIGTFIDGFHRKQRSGRYKLIFVVLVISTCIQLIGSTVNYQKIQSPLEYVFSGREARLRMMMRPRWNFIYQNLKILTTGRVDTIVEKIDGSLLRSVADKIGENVKDQDVSKEEFIQALARRNITVNEQERTITFFVGRDMDFMFLRYLRCGNVPMWVSVLLIGLVLMVLISGYFVLKPLFIEQPGDSEENKTPGRIKAKKSKKM